MIYCHIRPEKLVRFKRKRKEIAIQDVEALLLDPMFRAMVEFRKRVREVSERMNREGFR